MDFSLPLPWILGLVLCSLSAGQMAFWTSARIRNACRSRNNFREQQRQLRSYLRNSSTVQQTQPSSTLLHLNQPQAKAQQFAALQDAAPQLDALQSGVTWQGYRRFIVHRLVKETESTTSAYLVPADGKSLAPFQPGQYITLRLNIPGQRKPVIRCYTLSDSPDQPYYRISVKIVAKTTEPGLGGGIASHFINRELTPGQVVDVKAPAGDFFLQENSERLIVMLAGGIGITPMISMLNHLARKNSSRTVLLVYGVRNSGDHPFQSVLRERAHSNPDFHLVTCYSQPHSRDHLGHDYQVKGFVSVELLQKLVSQADAEFYVCGPPPFMKSLCTGLLAWGVDESDIRFEAFGPASISKPSDRTTGSAQTGVSKLVKFVRSEVASQTSGHQTLLELAESLQLPVDSGCRAGSCGTCCVALLKGQVEYPVGQKVECTPGHCLMCIARPSGEVELDV